jgi:secreted trypsin-like serine protease
VQTTITGPGILRYRWRVSSEEGFDTLTFYYDGSPLMGAISGSVDWVEDAWSIPSGTHTLRWEYAKDDTVASGADRGWLDKVEWITDAPVLLSVSRTGTGTGTVTSTPSGISCGSSCSANFSSGTLVTLTATPAFGSSFAGWSGACSGSTSTCNVSMSAARNVTASFTLIPDTTPGAFSFPSQAGVTVGSTVTSAAVTPTGYNAATAITVSNGQYSIGCSGSFTSVSGTLSPGQSLCLRHTAAGAPATTVTTTVSVGGVSATFSSTTAELSTQTLTVVKEGSGMGTVVSSNVLLPNIAERALVTPRIVGGVPASEGAWPWQVAVAPGPFLCGGALLSENWVLTAAHCLVDDFGNTIDPGSINVRVGSLNVSSGGTLRGVTSLSVHPSYEHLAGSFDHDIALLRLSSPVAFSQTVGSVAPILSSQESLLAFDGALATVTGWGTTSEGGSTSSTLMQVGVPIVSPQACRLTGYSPESITDNMICAGYPEGGKDACQGDSGGPLVVQDGAGGHLLTGVVSFGNGCARENFPGVYARVSVYVPWMEAVTGLSFDAAPSIDCGERCSAGFVEGTSVTLTATPAGGSSFAGWSGACSGSASTCTVTMSAARNVTANFTLIPDGPPEDRDGDGIADDLDPYPDDPENEAAERDAVDWRVGEVYIATLGRAMDAAGLRYWEQEINQKVEWSVERVAQSFFDQPEVQALYPLDFSTASFVAALYQNVLGRDPDAAGLDYWVAELETGRVSRNQMVIAMINGAWANPNGLANGDLARFRNRIAVGMAFVNYQEVNNLRQSELTPELRQRLRDAGREILDGVGSPRATLDAAIARIDELLGPIVEAAR